MNEHERERLIHHLERSFGFQMPDPTQWKQGTLDVGRDAEHARIMREVEDRMRSQATSDHVLEVIKVVVDAISDRVARAISAWRAERRAGGDKDEPESGAREDREREDRERAAREAEEREREERERDDRER